MSQPRITSVFLVRSGHLNHQGNLFGGHLMAEIDTIGYCLIHQQYPQQAFVTRAAEITFDAPARLGDLVEFSASVEKRGTTSLQVGVIGAVEGQPICRARMVYVHVTADGKKAALPGVGATGT
jgi:acyl-CoA hydrolase